MTATMWAISTHQHVATERLCFAHPGYTNTRKHQNKAISSTKCQSTMLACSKGENVSPPRSPVNWSKRLAQQPHRQKHKRPKAVSAIYNFDDNIMTPILPVPSIHQRSNEIWSNWFEIQMKLQKAKQLPVSKLSQSTQRPRDFTHLNQPFQLLYWYFTSVIAVFIARIEEEATGWSWVVNTWVRAGHMFWSCIMQLNFAIHSHLWIEWSQIESKQRSWNHAAQPPQRVAHEVPQESQKSLTGRERNTTCSGGISRYITNVWCVCSDHTQ